MPNFLTVLLLTASLVAPAAFAAEEEEEEEAEATHPFQTAIGISALSPLGAWAFHGERLVAPRHGVTLDGMYGLYGNAAGSWGGLAGYRFHFRPGLEGWFAGVSVGYASLDIETVLPEDDEQKDFRMEAAITALGANFGYRWLWGNGLGIVLRAGYGYQVASDFEWTPEPKDQDLKSLVETLQSLDLETSVGYSF